MSINSSTDAIARAVFDLLLPELQKLVSTPSRKLLNEAEDEARNGFGRGTYRYYRNYKPELAPPGVRIGKRMKYDPEAVDAHFAKVGKLPPIPGLALKTKIKAAVAVTASKEQRPVRRRFVKREVAHV